jgi:uncharacterized protein YndB with AHSA1/START domain
MMPENPSVTHSTFTIERHYPAAPERVFSAFSDPARKRRWFAEGEGFAVDSFEMDFRVGGFERARFRFAAGQPLEEGTPCANDTVYTDIVDNRRIALAYTMTVAGHRISSSQATFELLPDGDGTQLVFTEQAAFFEGADGAEIREKGWRGLLDQLAKELAH